MAWLGALLAAASGVCGTVAAIGEKLEGNTTVADAALGVIRVLFGIINWTLGIICFIIMIVVVINHLFPNADLTHTTDWVIFDLASKWILWIGAGLGASLVVFILLTKVVSAAVIALNKSIGSMSIKFIGLMLGVIGGLILYFDI